jgi:hypothetical protein
VFAGRVDILFIHTRFVCRWGQHYSPLQTALVSQPTNICASMGIQSEAILSFRPLSDFLAPNRHSTPLLRSAFGMQNLYLSWRISKVKKSLLSMAFSIALASCQTDSNKLERLEREKTIECLLQDASWKKYEAAAYPNRATLQKVKSPAADSLGREWNNHRVKCELATRDLNKFLR